ncbi:N-6 DNA methylase [Lentzea flaviverrucosa]|uniref:Type I restriction-modification system, DNA methylase subunit n=1 Tax=Lentzea flaviverrucosa TaxID=200379 RepID=A0A1H9WS14_9PSEU|nr:N-6 DNA methylase [Lentzea flaviverrucosa]RDI23040.1 type I restriction-modification system DNA methylase subunit [Lentzea flaviverrucosa]SES36579.1 Type I restriction-modification system, DNA methylase subunit [Lentzea flaviverrucosa]
MVDGGGTPVTVTLAEIARIAGVSRAAVGNWRRRRHSFPVPVRGSDSSPLFELAAVEKWLRENGKLADTDHRELLWPRLEALGEREGAGLVVAAAGMRAAGVELETPDLSAAQEQLASELLSLIVADGAPTFEFFLRRWQQANARQLSSTPPPLARLIVEMAEIERGAAPVTVLDPACGNGELLAAATERWETEELKVLGQERDPVLKALAAARTALMRRGSRNAVVRPGDALRADAHADARADVVVCSPPFNDRAWGHEELATDPRWVHGLPPRTEPELAWVEHVLARMAPGGTGVLLLPPAVASRRAGRGIRSSLVRTGALRAVIALPVGAASPYSLSLHLWVLRTPAADHRGEDEVAFVDASRIGATRSSVDWSLVRRHVLNGLSGRNGRAVPVVDLLDSEVDLTPGRHVPTRSESVVTEPEWSSFGHVLASLTEMWNEFSDLEIAEPAGAERATTTVGDLQRAGALTIVSGQALPDSLPRSRSPEPGAVQVLLVADLLAGSEPTTWLAEDVVRAAHEAGEIVLAEENDVVVAALSRRPAVRVVADTTFVLGPQHFALRPDLSMVDPWFVAGCLRAPSNVRQAGSHSSAASRVDVRKLRLLNLTLAEQRRSGELAKNVEAFEQLLRDARKKGEELVKGLGEALFTGTLHEIDRS